MPYWSTHRMMGRISRRTKGCEDSVGVFQCDKETLWIAMLQLPLVVVL